MKNSYPKFFCNEFGDFVEILKCVEDFGFRVVSFYSGGVDDLGWIWGNVLLRNVIGKQSGRVACSPRDKAVLAPANARKNSH